MGRRNNKTALSATTGQLIEETTVQRVHLKRTSVSVSRFIFGTASLFNSGTEKLRAKLLFSAVDAGFVHFDTAPYYGFGTAERDLAPVLRTFPNVTVTTKVGIYSPGGESQSAAGVFIRKIAGQFVKSFSRPTVDFSLQRAARSLEDSLRRLSRDRIDIYTLHEPELELLHTDEWRKWLEKTVVEGKVRAFGLALTAEKLEPFLRQNCELAQLVQVQDSLAGREADILPLFGRPLQITYGYVSAARKARSSLPVMDVLRRALRRNTEGAIIVSTTKVARLPQYAQLSKTEVQ
jgi:D-threo-aldose 1-dehydrogenase